MGVLLRLAMFCMPLGILAAETVWYVPGWLRCGSPDEKVLAELRLAFPQAKVVFRDWDGNGLLQLGGDALLDVSGYVWPERVVG